MSGQSTGNLSCGHRGRMVQFQAQEPKLSQVACDVVLFVSYVVSVLFIFILYYLYVILCYLVGFLLIICMLSRNTSAWKLSNLIAIKVHFKDERRSQEHIEKRSEELSRTVTPSPENRSVVARNSFLHSSGACAEACHVANCCK